MTFQCFQKVFHFDPNWFGQEMHVALCKNDLFTQIKAKTA
jgi:hypothetical protein